ncbi:hypothetical protein CSAL01_13708 [Colletotrichum salicis]|uniref:Uncharacterized protein n=1 Tax=Colletotrichum salicis TaxID=1209931 RepID=A0A135S0F3_9PEZI|nr:hypothetical protein CSAL01_13708 [Colletotrichum salicis]
MKYYDRSKREEIYPARRAVEDAAYKKLVRAQVEARASGDQSGNQPAPGAAPMKLAPWQAPGQYQPVPQAGQSGNQPASSVRSRSPLPDTIGHDSDFEAASRRSASPTSNDEHIRNLRKDAAFAEGVDPDGRRETTDVTKMRGQRRGAESHKLHRKDNKQRKKAPYWDKYALSEDQQHRIELQGKKRSFPRSKPIPRKQHLCELRPTRPLAWRLCLS